jgi:hypothetical protein
MSKYGEFKLKPRKTRQVSKGHQYMTTEDYVPDWPETITERDGFYIIHDQTGDEIDHIPTDLKKSDIENLTSNDPDYRNWHKAVSSLAILATKNIFGEEASPETKKKAQEVLRKMDFFEEYKGIAY